MVSKLSSNPTSVMSLFMSRIPADSSRTLRNANVAHTLLGLGKYFLFFPLSYDYEYDSTPFRTYGICEDNLVSLWDIVDPNQCRIQIRPISSHPANIISAGGPIVLNVSLPGTRYPLNPASCPASGRFVYLDRNHSHRIAIVDFLPYP